MKDLLFSISIGAAIAGTLCAQGLQRQANMVGGGSPNGGKCTIEVVVDGAAQVEIRGTTATLRDVNGQQPQWRRFECTGAMPANPANFHFQGIDGRGRQTLTRDPRNGGVAAVEIQDSSSGAQAYTFDITWGGVQSNERNAPQYDNVPNNGPQNNRPQNNGQYRDRSDGAGDRDRGEGRGEGDQNWGDPGYRPNWRESQYYRQYGHGFGNDDAISACKNAIADQARQRFGTSDVHFLRTRIDDNPGRNDSVLGTIDVHPNRPGQVFSFSCSVNFDTGTIRSAHIDERSTGWDPRWR
jgi:hypothetical protein